jgi:hypothetical protein
MNSTLPSYKIPIVFSSIGILFHLCFVVLSLVITGGSGEWQSWIVLVLDFPLVFFLQNIPHGNSFLYGSSIKYIIFFTFFGTAMYAVFGWCVGYFLEYMRKDLR